MIIIEFIDLFSTLFVLFILCFSETNFRLEQQLSHFTIVRSLKN